MNPKYYDEALDLYKKLEFKLFREWLILYQTLDIKLLTDFWLNFRDMCYETYKLDPGHYYSAPGLAWDAFLKYTKVELGLITDPEMSLMFDA